MAKLTQKSFIKFLIPSPNVSMLEILAESIGSTLGKGKKKTTDVADTDQDPDQDPDQDLNADWEATLADVDTKVESAKHKLDADDIKKSIEGVLRAVDLYGGLRYRITRDYNGQNVTNAWIKLYEIVTQIGLIAPRCEGKVRAFFNAELPGAFTVAMNHFMKTRCPAADYQWVASSFYPRQSAATEKKGEDPESTILGDKYGLYACNRNNWLMDAPTDTPADAKSDAKYINNGDVTDVKNLLDLADRARNRLGGGATLYTSDAGIDVSHDYGRQEELTSLINLGQIVLGLMSLDNSGDMVTKQYTYSKPFSATLLAIISGFFSEFFVTKPKTSRPANSEIYAVGKGFRGIVNKERDSLLAIIQYCSTNSTLPTILGPLSKSVALAPSLEALIRATRQIHMRQQVEFLEEAVKFAGRRDASSDAGALRRDLAKLSFQCQDAWLSDNPISQIRTVDHIPSKLAGGKCSPKIGGATFNRPVVLAVEYAQWGLTQRLLSLMKAAIMKRRTDGAVEKMMYEASNILERWIMAVANEKPPNALPEWATVYWKFKEDETFNVQLAEEIAAKNLCDDSKELARSILAAVFEFLEKEPTGDAIAKCDGSDGTHVARAGPRSVPVSLRPIITCGDFKAPANDRAMAALRRGKSSPLDAKECDTMAGMMLRYATVISGGQQWGLPIEHADDLYSKFGVRNEGFASPLNSRFSEQKDASFCSLFGDTDKPFGSVGDFFAVDMEKMPGNWEINPPFVNSIMSAAATKAVSFVADCERKGKDVKVFFMMPAWDDSECYKTLSSSRLSRLDVRLRRGKYQFELPDGRRIPAAVDCFYFLLSSTPLDLRDMRAAEHVMTFAGGIKGAAE